jgi:hypothetical protein
MYNKRMTHTPIHNKGGKNSQSTKVKGKGQSTEELSAYLEHFISESYVVHKTRKCPERNISEII